MNTPRKDKCMYEGEHGVCTRVQGCSESREESAEPAPKGSPQCGGSNAIGRRAVSITEHREA